MTPSEISVNTLYWTILAASISAIWIVTTYIRDRAAQSMTLSSALMTRLMEYDKLNLEHPEIQQYLSKHVARDEAYFHSDEALADLAFYKAKSLVYNQLNLFDEILSITAKTNKGLKIFKPAYLMDTADWEEYIKVKLRHPLYRSIMNHEKHIFGAQLRAFWVSHKDTIESKLAVAHIW